MWNWHMALMDSVREAHKWQIDEEKSHYGKREQVGIVHDPQKGLETHRDKEKTYTWEGVVEYTSVSEVLHWIMIRRMSG